jgi:hypothetical protein
MVVIFTTNFSFAEDDHIFDKSQLHKGVISGNYHINNIHGIKIMIQKGKDKHFYNLEKNKYYPLAFGNGEYFIAILESVEGKKYKVVAHEKINLNLKDENIVYLNSTQTINWNNNMESIIKAKELTKNLKTDKEKITAIYKYIINNISYDNEKIPYINKNYVPNIEITYEVKKGICYDYTSLFASMLRSINIPTKLVKGNKNDINTYHAWNEVYISDTNEWIIIDTTYDAHLLKNNLSYSMIKNSNEYFSKGKY